MGREWYILKLHVHEFVDTGIHEISWLLQPTRPFDRVSSKFIRQSEDNCRQTIQIVFVFVPHLKSN